MQETQNDLAARLIEHLPRMRSEKLRQAFLPPQAWPHRLQFVREVGGVYFYDDSKATTVQASVYALQSFSQPIVWIAGGLERNNEYGEIFYLARAKVRALILIGDSPKRLEETFRDVLPHVSRATSMEEAVRRAYQLAQKNDVVLLSPMCASFDWYKDYMERGMAFQKAVHAL